MSKCIVFVNQKGGVGKTTSAINIGAYIALAGKKVLLVDFDSQGNMSSGVGVTKDKPTVYELLAGMVKPEEAVKHTPVQNLDAISASIDLSGAAIELVDQENREYFLKNALEPLKSQYDYILIDCPPSLGLIVDNALYASDSVLIPVECSFYAYDALTQMINKIDKVQKEKDIEIEGILITKLDNRTTVGYDIVDKVKFLFPNKIFKTIITYSTHIQVAPSVGQSLLEYSINSRGSKEYKALALEILGENNND